MTIKNIKMKEFALLFRASGSDYNNLSSEEIKTMEKNGRIGQAALLRRES
jgi:hypothetical protein